LGATAVLAMLLITAWPGLPAERPRNASPVVLEGLPTFFAGGRPQLHSTRVDKNGNTISDENLPQPFLDAAKRVQLEAAIRAAAEKLEEQRDKKAKLEHEYDVAAAAAVKDGANAELLHQRAAQQAADAIEQQTKSKVEMDKATSEKERMELEKKIATLMTFKSRHLKDEEEKATAAEKAAQAHADTLKTKAAQLKATAHSEGENANAIVRTAKELLASAKELSSKAATMPVAASMTAADAKEKSLLERLHDEKAAAHAVYERDMHDLAKAQLKMKGLTGVEGIDEVSRTEEGIADAHRKLERMGQKDDDDEDADDEQTQK